jgi:hypothetical protein
MGRAYNKNGKQKKHTQTLRNILEAVLSDQEGDGRITLGWTFG